MAPKRSIDAEDTAPEAKKPRHGFRVGPENLPDGPWRRKVTKIKKDLIHKAKVKKAYAKIKARENQAAGDKTPQAATKEDDEAEEQQAPVDDETSHPMHPTRQLMIKDEDKAQANSEQPQDEHEHRSDGHRRRTRRPGYYDKQLKKADQRRLETQERRDEFQRRQEERERKLAERERFKKAMAKTRGRDGKKKLGRESALLLDKVKRLVNEK